MRWSWPSLTRCGRTDGSETTGVREHSGLTSPRARHHDTITITTRHDTIRYDTTRQSRRRGAYRAKRPRRPAHPDIILGPSRAAFPVLRHLSSFTLSSSSCCSYSSTFSASPRPPPLLPRAGSCVRVTEPATIFLRVPPAAEPSSSRSALTAQLDGVTSAADGDSRLLLSAKMAAALSADTADPTLPIAARATPRRPGRPITSIRRRLRCVTSFPSFLLGATEIWRSNESDTDRSNQYRLIFDPSNILFRYWKNVLYSEWNFFTT